MHLVQLQIIPMIPKTLLLVILGMLVSICWLVDWCVHNFGPTEISQQSLGELPFIFPAE